MLCNQPLWFNILIHCLDTVSQILIVKSSLPDAKELSSREIAKQLIFCL